MSKIKEDSAITTSVGQGMTAGLNTGDLPPVNKKRNKDKETTMIKRFKDYVAETHHDDEFDSGEEILDERGCSKGEKKMKKNMETEYGKKKGEKVFFATKNKK
jgi:hypothetical protein